MEISDFVGIDQNNRTPIHRLVWLGDRNLTLFENLNYIEHFIKHGYDIDAQDCFGRTALYLAMMNYRENGINGLLLAGADLNIVSIIDATPLTLIDKNCSWKLSRADPKHRKYQDCVIKAVALQVIRLQTCVLEVTSENIIVANRELSEDQVQHLRQKILKELDDAKLVKIGTGSLTLKDFLSETGAIASRPSIISEVDRQEIENFFESIDLERFPELSYLFKLQHRKMLTRLAQIEDAAASIRNLLGSHDGFYMPEICCRIIIRFLTNTDVKNIIKAALNVNNDQIV